MNDWKEYKLGEVCQTNLVQYKENQGWNDFLYLDTSNITENQISELQCFNYYKDLPSRARRIVENDDIIYSTVRPNLKHYGIIKNKPENLLVSTGFCVITANKTIVNPDFLYYILSQQENVDYLHKIAEQAVSTYPSIKASDIEALNLNLPPLLIQQKIAAILSSLDEKIETNRKINARLEELAQTIFKSWFIDFTPFGGKMPQDWKECKLEDVILVKYGKDHKNLTDGKFPVFGSGGILRFVEKPLYEKESVLIPRKGSLNNIIYVDDPFWSVDTMFFTEMKKENLAKYIFFLLKRLDFQSMNCGSAIPSMTTSILNGLRINLPPEEILIKFNTIINPFFFKIKSLNKESTRLASLRDTLLPKLMSGEIKV